MVVGNVVYAHIKDCEPLAKGMQVSYSQRQVVVGRCLIAQEGGVGRVEVGPAACKTVRSADIGLPFIYKVLGHNIKVMIGNERRRSFCCEVGVYGF